MVVLGPYRVILGGTSFYFKEFCFWKICFFLLRDLSFFLYIGCWEIYLFLLRVLSFFHYISCWDICLFLLRALSVLLRALSFFHNICLRQFYCGEICRDCWCSLLLRDLSGFVERFEINICYRLEEKKQRSVFKKEIWTIYLV